MLLPPPAAHAQLGAAGTASHNVGMAQSCNSMPAAVRARIQDAGDPHPCDAIWQAGAGDLAAAHADGLARAAPVDPIIMQVAAVAAAAIAAIIAVRYLRGRRRRRRGRTRRQNRQRRS